MCWGDKLSHLFRWEVWWPMYHIGTERITKIKTSPGDNHCSLKRAHQAESLESSSQENPTLCCWELLQRPWPGNPGRTESDPSFIFVTNSLPDQRHCSCWDASFWKPPWCGSYFIVSILTILCCMLIVCNKLSDSQIECLLLFHIPPIDDSYLYYFEKHRKSDFRRNYLVSGF